jgi:FkbM family methyltransferase
MGLNGDQMPILEFKDQTFKDKTFRVIKGVTHPEYSYFTFEGEEREFRDKYWDIKSGDIVFDVGASYGTYTLSACAAGATVYSFEPEITVFEDLVNNINLNNWRSTCFLANVGLWNYCTTVHMNSYAPHWSKDSISGNYRMFPLDQVIEEHNIEKIDWIKIDVEGAEFKCLQGGLSSIKKFKPNLIIECHIFLDKEILNDIRKLLSIYDYEFEVVEREPCQMLIARQKGKV